jgi:hypothetical protein
MKEVVDDTRGDHETWVDRATDYSAQRIPCSWIEPIPEFVEAIFCKNFGSSAEQMILVSQPIYASGGLNWGLQVEPRIAVVDILISYSHHIPTTLAPTTRE